MGKTVVLYKLHVCLNTIDAFCTSIIFKQTQGFRQTGSLGIWDAHLSLNKQYVSQ